MTQDQAEKRANEIWSDVYMVRQMDSVWKVWIHSPNGPIGWMDADGNDTAWVAED